MSQARTISNMFSSLLPGGVGAATKVVSPMVRMPAALPAAARTGPTIGAIESSAIGSLFAALPNLMTSIGQIGTAQSQLAQAGLSKVLESALPASYLGNLGASYQITK